MLEKKSHFCVVKPLVVFNSVYVRIHVVLRQNISCHFKHLREDDLRQNKAIPFSISYKPCFIN